MKFQALISILFAFTLTGCPEPQQEEEPLAAGGCCLPTSGGCADGPDITSDGCDGLFYPGRTCSDDNTACE